MVDCAVVTSRLAEALAGRRILLTGATGFVGEAILERLLHDLPDATVVVLVRSRPGQSAEDRVALQLQSPAYGRLREQLGEAGINALVGSRVTVLEGDLTHIPPLPADLDIVIHCAGEVSFDPPIDEGFATNVHGTLNLLAAVEASGSRPHYLHVSTAYVAGRQQGHVREGRLEHDIDWRAEAAIAATMRERFETDSRLPDQLGEFIAGAEREHGHSGHTAVGADAERRRREWASKAMVDAGRQRARTLGWTDCYTFTKAMAERAVEQTAAHLPVTILRPSIIESALEQPYPGWIEGFKMAEPIILAFGRGDLPDFPGLPDGTIDIIPVDLVVNATLAAAAQTPEPGDPAYFTICSGARNPLTFHRLYQLVRGYFTENPLVQPDRGAVRVPEWQWPGSARVGQLLDLGEKAHKVVDRVVTSLPRSDRSRGWARSLDRQKRRIDFLRRYFDLYRPYADAELIFHDSRTLALHESLHPDDVATFGFDAAVIDWPEYLIGIHVPGVVEPMRAFTTSRPPRPDPKRDVTPAENAVAVFDMDGTLLPSNVVESYLWLRLPELPTGQRAREVVDVAGALPRWLATQRRDRGSVPTGRLPSLRGRPAQRARADRGCRRDNDRARAAVPRRGPCGPRASGRGLPGRAGDRRRVAAGPAGGRVVRRDRLRRARGRRGGRCTGHLARPPLVGEARAAWLRHRAREDGWDLSVSYAYADSASDLPLLRSVGHPVAVDPDVILSRVAHKERWPVEGWHAGAPVGRSLVRAR